MTQISKLVNNPPYKDHEQAATSSGKVKINQREREKGRYLTQYYDKSPYTKQQRDNTKRHQKLRLHNDCGPTLDGQLE